MTWRERIGLKIISWLFPLEGETTVGTRNERDRQDWVAGQLRSLPAGTRLLDAGAGEMQYKKYCDHLQYVSQDFAQYDPKTLPVGLQMGEWNYGKLDIVSDIAHIPEADGSFGAILCTEVLEHIPHPLEALREFGRLLPSGGQLILTAPFCSMTHFAPYHFYTGFSRYFYEKYLPENGFKIVELSPNGNYFEYLAQELNRLPVMSTRYHQSEIPPIYKRSAQILLELLQKNSLGDKGSAELLHFGWHVRAEKL